MDDRESSGDMSSGKDGTPKGLQVDAPYLPPVRFKGLGLSA